MPITWIFGDLTKNGCVRPQYLYFRYENSKRFAESTFQAIGGLQEGL